MSLKHTDSSGWCRGELTLDRSGKVFFRAADHEADLIPVSVRLSRALLKSDKVLAKLDFGKQELPKLVDLKLESRALDFVGVYAGKGVVKPLYKINVPEMGVVFRGDLNPRTGDAVLVHAATARHRDDKPGGEVVEILGDRTTVSSEVEAALHAYGIAHVWKDQVLHEAELAAKRKDPLGNRVDLQKMNFVTIDGEDARDFDDAFYCEKSKSGWTLWVAIADVASYVKHGSDLDEDAAQRGNSVYFPGQVVPMLPEILSDQHCSLRPKVKRRVLVCRMDITATGVLQDYSFLAALICSKARLNYTQVGLYLQGSEPLATASKEVARMVRTAYGLYKKLAVVRDQRSALQFDTVETKIWFDREGKFKTITPVTRNDAHRLIEEFMILANVSAALFLAEAKQSLLYRAHLGLKKDAAGKLKDFFQLRGLTFHGTTAKEISMLLKEAVGRDDETIIQMFLLRNMARAAYQPEQEAHFGLALDNYTHFTSPIRRYPDLLVHRAIHRVLGGGGAFFRQSAEDLKAVGAHCSATEKTAEEASRSVENFFKCLNLSSHVGKCFPGLVSGVQPFGLFVEIQGFYVDGLLHINCLPRDSYSFDEAAHSLRGFHRGTAYNLGQQLQVVVAAVNPEERKVELTLEGVKKRLRRSGFKRRRKFR